MNPVFTISQLKELLAEYFKDKPVLKAYLFGSYARNQADEKSDIDILLDLEYRNGIAKEYVKMVKELRIRLNKKIHLVSSDAVSTPIKEIINKEKILLYER